MSDPNPQKGAYSDLEIDGTSPAAATLAALARIADAVTGIVDVAQGYQEYGECESWQSDVGELQREKEGKVAVWFVSARTSNGMDVTIYRYAGELVVRVPRKYSSYMGQAIDLAWALADAWQTRGNYVAADCELAPRTVDMTYVRLRRIDEAGIAYFEYAIEVPGP